MISYLFTYTGNKDICGQYQWSTFVKGRVIKLDKYNTHSATVVVTVKMLPRHIH